MSFDAAALQPQIDEIKTCIREYPNANIVQLTNKRTIIECTDAAVAYTLARDLDQLGYVTESRRGRLTDKGFVQAWFQYPY